MGHATLTTSLQFVILKLGYDIVYLCTKFDDSSFSTEILLKDRKFKMGHVTLTMPFLRVTCPPYRY